jgi:MFS family permease
MSSTHTTASERSPLLRPSRGSHILTEAHDNDNYATHEATPLSKTRGVLIAASVFILVFILTANASLISTIQSPIAIDLGAYSSVSWFTSAYLIAGTSVTPLAGRLSQIFSPKIYLFASICLQCTGLLITSLSSTLWQFLLGRAITGMGGGAVTPVSFILVTSLTSKKRRGLFFGLVNTGYTAGVACGAIVAGALEPVVGWRAVFILQIPVAFTAATVALFAIPNVGPWKTKQSATRSVSEKLSHIDYFGTFTLISAVVLLLYALSSPRIDATPIILSVAMLSLFIFVEAKWAHEPIVPVAVLRSRGTLFTCLSILMAMAGRWAVLFYTPVYAIAVRSWSQASAGLMLLPTNGGFALGGILAGGLHIKRAGSFYIACLAAYLLFIISLFCISQISTADSSIYSYVAALFINGFATGAFLNYSLVHVLHLTIPATHLIVIPVNSMFRSLSTSLGSSVCGGLFLRTLHSALEAEFDKRGLHDEDTLITRLLGTPVLVKSLSGAEKEAALLAYQISFRTLFMAGTVTAIVAALVQAGTGWTAPEVPEDDVDVLSNHVDLSPAHSR